MAVNLLCTRGNLDRKEASSRPNTCLSSSTTLFSEDLRSSLAGMIPLDCAVVGRLNCCPGKDESNFVILMSTAAENSWDTFCTHGRADTLGTQKASMNINTSVIAMLPPTIPKRTRSPLIAFCRGIFEEEPANLGTAVIARIDCVFCVWMMIALVALGTRSGPN